MNDKIEKNKCHLCQKKFNDSSALRKHKLKKTSCIPNENLLKIKNDEHHLQETVKKLLEENLSKEIETKKLLEKEIETKKLLEEKEQEIIRLKKLMETNLTKEDVKEIKDEIIKKIDSNGNNSNINYNMTQNNNNDNKKLNFNIQLAKTEKERFDHIPVEQMLCILDQKDFSNSIADLVQAVSFNPRAPENMTWCINDKTAENGAIEYNSDLNMLTRNSSSTVISKNVQNILFPITDIFKEMELTLDFNSQQNQNCARYFNMLGEDNIKKEYINSIRDRAYDKRGLCKALWEHLEIGLETKKIKTRK